MRLILMTILLFTMTGCIATYRDFPVDAIGKKPEAGNCDVLYYNVKRFDILDSGGYNRLQTMFRDASICKKMVEAEAAPEKGLYVEIETKWKPMTMPAFVFGYLSLSTLTFLPAWSTHDGYVVNYNIYLDGQKKETYRYDITRKAGLWAGLLPLAWINLFTYSEEDAFEATTSQMATDAREYFSPNAH